MTNIDASIKTIANQLVQLGWSDDFANRLAAMEPTGGRMARVISVQRGQFQVADGHEEWLCAVAGKLRHSSAREYPVTGDWVLTEDGVITGVIPRRNLLSRGEAGSRNTRGDRARREQPIAANLDTVFIVCGLDRDFNTRRLERYLTLVHNHGLEPVVVLTKADLHDDPAPFKAEVEAIAFATPVILSSTSDNQGKEELETYLGPGRTVAMLGSSGAGKSSLANLLHGSNVQLTGDVSQSVGKGRHTTTTRDLIRMPQGGMLMDNPGIREIAFHEEGDGVESAFSDISELAEVCRFGDCSHTTEPGCAVLRAVQDGELKPDRFESYRKMQQEMEYLSQRRAKSADRIEKERWRGVSQFQKQMKKRGGKRLK